MEKLLWVRLMQWQGAVVQMMQQDGQQQQKQRDGSSRVATVTVAAGPFRQQQYSDSRDSGN